jgi:hypothetical protein
VRWFGVGSVSAEQCERVWDEIKYSFERGDSAFGRTGKIHDKRAAAGAGNRAAERGQWRAAGAGGAHAFGKAIENAGADGARCFRGDVARRDSGAAGSDNKFGMGGMGAQRGFDLGLLVGDEMRAVHGKASGLKRCGDCGPGEIRAIAAAARIADSEDYSPGWL